MFCVNGWWRWWAWRKKLSMRGRGGGGAMRPRQNTQIPLVWQHKKVFVERRRNGFSTLANSIQFNTECLGSRWVVGWCHAVVPSRATTAARRLEWVLSTDVMKWKRKNNGCEFLCLSEFEYVNLFDWILGNKTHKSPAKICYEYIGNEMKFIERKWLRLCKSLPYSPLTQSEVLNGGRQVLLILPVGCCMQTCRRCHSIVTYLCAHCAPISTILHRPLDPYCNM